MNPAKNILTRGPGHRHPITGSHAPCRLQASCPPSAPSVHAAQGPMEGHSAPCSLGEEQQPPPTAPPSEGPVGSAFCLSQLKEQRHNLLFQAQHLSLRAEKMHQRKSSEHPIIILMEKRE